LLAADPIAIDELGKQGAPDAARSAQINVFYGSVLPYRCELQARDLAIDHQSDAPQLRITL